MQLGRTHQTGPNLTLGLLPEAEAERLGAVFAGIEPWSAYPYPAPDLARYFARIEPDAPRFAAFLDGKICGVLGMRLNWLRGPYVQFLGLVPGYQRLGLGAALLDYVEHHARTARERNVFVCVSEFNHGAVRFYQREGYCEVGRLDDLVVDGRSEILMRKRLGT